MRLGKKVDPEPAGLSSERMPSLWCTLTRQLFCFETVVPEATVLWSGNYSGSFDAFFATFWEAKTQVALRICVGEFSPHT